ncbi:variant leucine-rich repeat-containing protein [Pseudoclavibacter sp. 13-3]|uniref:variant leucine-rich repeat-containing protein n=1 Tax=Pseudoclavibacter sp. 13-3 TaxID=2901228 RepID=UPI001E52D623|nr:hypothetical protein [Pseudoclavibacter sp. 13-3]MCD7101198.1 hypothetical protein [Pseudoclavibacter sp. 13-3]
MEMDAEQVRRLMVTARDPRTSAADLQRVAQYATTVPSLIPALLSHQNMYPGLAHWLQTLPGASAVLSGAGRIDAVHDDEPRPSSAYLVAGGASAASAAGAAALGLAGGGTEAAAISASGGAGAVGASTTGTAKAGVVKAGLAKATLVKIGAGVVGLAVVGSAAGMYVANQGLPWAPKSDTANVAAPPENVHADATAPDSSAQPSQASKLSDQQLLALLPTAPVGEAERDYLTHMAPLTGGAAAVPANYSASTISTGTNGGIRVVNDGRLITTSTFPGLSGYSTTRSQQPVIRDVDGDGTDDIVTIVTNPVPKSGISTGGSSEGLAALTVYSPTDDGAALTIRSQMVIFDEWKGVVQSEQTGSHGADPALDQQYRSGGGKHTSTRMPGGYTALSLSTDGTQVTVRRSNYWGSEWMDLDPDEGADTVTYPIVWTNGGVSVGPAAQITSSR